MPGSIPGWTSAFVASSATSTLISSQILERVGPLKIGRKPEKKCWNDCGVLPLTCAACVTLVEMIGGFAFYTYSNEKYELSVFPDGSFRGKPEDAFAASAMYLE